MKRIIVVLISLLLLTGCTIDYNLVIDKDSIKETITGTASKEEYEVREEDSGLNLFYTYINDDINPLISGDGLYTKDINEIDNGINYKYDFIYKNNYDKSKIINSCFENSNVKETDTYYSIELSGEFYCLYSDKININVISNYAVLENNAKEVNGNKYSWVIDDSSNVNIFLNISKEIKYEEPSKTKFISTFQLVGLIIFVVLTGITYILYRKKNSGKV